jgi:pimeloyl-ACP methyl ester carboxylesterase
VLGDSTRPAGTYDKKTLGADVAALVIGHLGFDRFHLVGHDWGGPVAFSVAAHNPDAVRTLTILDVVIPGDGGDFSQGGRRWHHAFFRTLDLPEQLCFGREELVINRLFETFWLSCQLHFRRRQGRVLAYPQEARCISCAARNLPGSPTGRRGQQEYSSAQRQAKDARARARGDKSFGRGAECIKSLRRVAENVRGGLVKDCGHWIAEEQPHLLVEQLLGLFNDYSIR